MPAFMPSNLVIETSVAEKQDELKQSFKHPAPFSAPESATT